MRVPRPPHPWSVSPQQAIAIQQRLAFRVRQEPIPARVRLVAGLDAAFSADGRVCIAAAVVWDLIQRRVVERRVATRPLAFPYVPGLLSFREAPALLAALRKLRARPDALMCDGHGFAHPRRFGIACHIGLITALPTVGCAKSRLIGTHVTPAMRRGSLVALRDKGQVIGAVLRTQDGIRPVYVSIGHKADLASAVRLVLASACRFRLPEPTRLADRLVAQMRIGHSRHAVSGRDS